MSYNFTEIEKKWSKYWEENDTFKTDLYDFSKPKYYVLDMFPYPSGQGLHIGHPEGYTASDIVARFKKMQGFNVLHPMGFDAFGLPAEQYAIKTGNHPGDFTKKNIQTFKNQLNMLGLSFDWSKEISTCEPNFYKWTQWLFKQLYLDGYARLVDTAVNWCEELGTVLANDEIIDGKSERGGYPVVRKNMKQWVINIPADAENLLKGLDQIEWAEYAKESQRNWIGKSVGARVTFKIADSDKSFDVFTTRCDTLFGATYCVLSPEHTLIDEITSAEQKDLVKDYKYQCSLKSDFERTEMNKDKTGVFVGAYAINPVNGKKLPIFISDYVLTSYGTGAIMAVPAHDQRDYEFAKKFDLPIVQVIEGGDISKEAYEGDGLHINSEFLNGLDKQTAINKMLEWLNVNGVGEKTINYKIREWIFARQRYWGEPMPVAYKPNGETVLIDDDDLPVVLPELKDYQGKNGQAPLANATDWKYIQIDGTKCLRETSTMPGSAGSSWYYLRYLDPHNDKALADPKLIEHWMPVDLYVGGAEHLTGHLIYSRFVNHYLYQKGIVKSFEPFKKIIHQGMILGENNEKMSKSKGNVINPDKIVAEYGADTLRMYEMFMGPIQDAKPWTTKNIDGVKRFLDRVYNAYFANDFITEENDKSLEILYNQTVKKVTEDFENLYFNTAISQMMIFLNAVYKEKKFPYEYAENFIKLIAPIAPFIAEEIWHEYFKKEQSIYFASWPKFDKNKIQNATYEMVILVNGKLKMRKQMPTNASAEEMKTVAQEYISQNLVSAKIVDIIVVPNKLVNIVTEK